jgi:hypothetical protein
MRVLHLPTLVGGMAWGLAQGEKRLGLDSKVLTTSSTRFGYPHDISLHWENKSAVRVLLDSLWVFLKYRNQFDVFHFNFGSTLIDFKRYGIHHWDLPFYPSSKKIIFTYNGCDARQKYRTMERTSIAACHEKGCYAGICDNGKRDRMRRKRIRVASKHAHHLFAVNPDLLYFLPNNISSFLPYGLGNWYDLQATPYRIGKKIKIVHPTTDRTAKGSNYILRILENLKKRYPIEILLVENTPNKKALEIYAQADLLIDQVLAGWYGGVAVEGMRMGKPVCVYIREEDLNFIPKTMANDLREAVININLSNMERIMEDIFQNPQQLFKVSQAGLEYVNKWHDPVFVAGITKSVYES